MSTFYAYNSFYWCIIQTPAFTVFVPTKILLLTLCFSDYKKQLNYVGLIVGGRNRQPTQSGHGPWLRSAHEIEMRRRSDVASGSMTSLERNCGARDFIPLVSRPPAVTSSPVARGSHSCDMDGYAHIFLTYLTSLAPPPACAYISQVSAHIWLAEYIHRDYAHTIGLCLCPWQS